MVVLTEIFAFYVVSGDKTTIFSFKKHHLSNIIVEWEQFSMKIQEFVYFRF